MSARCWKEENPEVKEVFQPVITAFNINHSAFQQSSSVVILIYPTPFRQQNAYFVAVDAPSRPCRWLCLPLVAYCTPRHAGACRITIKNDD